VHPERQIPTSQTAEITRGAPKVVATALICAVALGFAARGRTTAIPPPGILAVAPRLIDLNTASAAELELLPGIGPTRAAEIVANRTERGPFRSVRDLDRVKGLGAITLKKLSGHVTVSPPTTRPR
jgi:competence ComEA-like helix-hairpin-helix protein